jgi:hypothetical protein
MSAKREPDAPYGALRARAPAVPGMTIRAVCTPRLGQLFCARMKFIKQSLRTLSLAAIVVWVACWTAFSQQPHTLTGDIRAPENFHSKILNNDRRLQRRQGSHL